MNETLIDYITGETIPNAGAEEIRQMFEKILVNEKGYAKEDILVDPPIQVTFKGELYSSNLDLVVRDRESKQTIMAVKCVPGALESHEREILAGARLIYENQIPLSLVTDGRDALVRNTITGKRTGQGIAAIPDKEEAKKIVSQFQYSPFPAPKKDREMIIFRSYDMDRKHRKTALPSS